MTGNDVPLDQQLDYLTKFAMLDKFEQPLIRELLALKVTPAEIDSPLRDAFADLLTPITWMGVDDMIEQLTNNTKLQRSMCLSGLFTDVLVQLREETSNQLTPVLLRFEGAELLLELCLPLSVEFIDNFNLHLPTADVYFDLDIQDVFESKCDESGRLVGKLPAALTQLEQALSRPINRSNNNWRHTQYGFTTDGVAAASATLSETFDADSRTAFESLFPDIVPNLVEVLINAPMTSMLDRDYVSTAVLTSFGFNVEHTMLPPNVVPHLDLGSVLGLHRIRNDIGEDVIRNLDSDAWDSDAWDSSTFDFDSMLRSLQASLRSTL